MKRVNGLRLAALNAALAIFCIGSFIGTLGATVLLSDWLAAAGRPAAVPFPFPVLLFLYAALFLISWSRFGRRLEGTRAERLRTAAIGASPLFALSVPGYAAVMWMHFFGDFEANQMLTAGVFVYSAISTLVLGAGLVCLWLVGLRVGAPAADGDVRW